MVQTLGSEQDVNHDDFGNMTKTAPVGIGGVLLTYDEANQPVTMSGASGAQNGSFLYDGNFKRVKQTIGNETIYSVYGLSGQLQFRDNITTSEATDYFDVGGKTIARHSSTDGLTYLHDDHLGSPIVASSWGGGIKWQESYTPYGEKLFSDSQNDNGRSFTGHIQDTDSGLTYMQARYYNPIVGRFLSNDPVGFSDGGTAYFNRYAYTANNPVNAVDPDGRSFIGWSSIDMNNSPSPNIPRLYSLGGPTPQEMVGAGNALEFAVSTFAPGTGVIDAVQAISEGDWGGAALALATELPAAKALKAINKLNPCGCFVQGTLVETEYGLKPIEEIQVGELVVARHAETGETALKSVTDVIRIEDRQIWTLEFAVADGVIQSFETTDDHPWWNAERGWLRTDELTLSTVIETLDGAEARVISVGGTGRIEPVYNLTIADFHTYFVGEEQLLVHNCRKTLKKIAEVGDAVKTPDTNPEQFVTLKNGQGMRDTDSGLTWQKSKTNHSGDDVGEFKVGTKRGEQPTKNNKITVTRSDGCVSKKDGC